MIYGTSCSKCGTGSPANFRSNPTNYPQHKSSSWARAFGRGIAGIALFLFGLGVMFVLYWYLTNLDNIMRGAYYGNIWSTIILSLIIIPAIHLCIGGSSIYYGIRIISKT